MPIKRIDQLTFTRFIAILVVLFFHGGGGVYFQMVNIFPLSVLFRSAPTAVTYLYVLSGFVMSLAHYRPNEKFLFENYWKARIVRLYPLYIISFLLVCYYYADFVARIKLPKILANIFGVQAWFPNYAQSFNFPAWSITVEFFFYAVFPFFAFWAFRQSTKKIISISLAVWALSQIVHQALWTIYFPEGVNFLVYFPFFHLSSFILGAAAGIWFLREGRMQQIESRVKLFFFTGSILLTCVYVIVSFRSVQLPQGDQLMTGLLAPILTIVVITLAADKTRFSAFLGSSIFVMLGEISYAIYILHIPVKWLYERALENLNAANVFDYTYMPIMIAIGFAAHFLVDIPIREWFKKIIQRISLPLFFLDFGILFISVYLSFRFRFGTGREFDSYYRMILLVFWSSFLFRTIFSAIFNMFNPSILYGSFMQFFQPVLFSVTVSSVFVAGITYAAYSLHWFENFPRSIFAADWLIVLVLSLFVRYVFRLAGFYSLTKPSV